jgi:hypothetical protein
MVLDKDVQSLAYTRGHIGVHLFTYFCVYVIRKLNLLYRVFKKEHSKCYCVVNAMKNFALDGVQTAHF